VLAVISVPASQAADNQVRELPRFNSFYQDDGSCSEHLLESTETVIWNGRTWILTAPVSLVSPPSETKRNGTPLDVKPLSEFVTQAQKQGAVLASDDLANAAESSVKLRLVTVTHDLVAEGSGTFSLQTIIAVRLCGAVEKSSESTLYIGPRKGVILTEFWRSRKSQRWIDGYRDAFALSVANALEWAGDEANAMQSRNAQ
jgi:hypothetical protein